MGSVYEAYQEATGRRVAVKFMHPKATASESARRRFEREVELAAQLEHPNIVSVFDSGLQLGRHYYVMEFVDGRQLDDALLAGQCDVEQAVRMLQTICYALDYAHQRGVLHRDLKPANIMVDQAGQPRVLDFGLAKAIKPDGTASLQLTLSQPGELLGTLAYMSPEQARGDVQRTGVRSDVYALGAIAFELLTGQLPCPVEGSMALTLSGIEATEPLRPGSIRRDLDADLDAILLKALEKEPALRYATAADLAADFGRFLNHEVILARRASATMRLTRVIRRHRAASITGAVAIAVLAVTVTASIIGILQERDRTLDQAKIALAAQEWMDTALAEFDPNFHKVSKPVSVLDYLRKQSEKLEAKPPERLEVVALVHARLGKNYQELAYFDQAESHLLQALILRRRLFSAPDADLAQSLHDLAALQWKQGDYTGAKELYDEALGMRITLFGELNEETAMTRNDVAACLDRLKRHDEAEQLFRHVLDVRIELSGKDSERVAVARNNLATCLRSQREYADAAEVFRSVIASLRRIGGDDHRWLALAQHNLATCLLELEVYEEAKSLLLGAIEAKRERWGEQHPKVARSHYTLAEVELKLANCANARNHCSIALNFQRQKLPPDHEDIQRSTMLMERIEAACDEFTDDMKMGRDSGA